MLKKILIMLLGCTLLLSGCGSSNNDTDDVVSETPSTQEEVIVDTEEEEKEETAPSEEPKLEAYYEDNDLINLYLNNYNAANPDNLIEKGSFEKYYHHGSEHDDQIIFNTNDFEVVISDNFKLEVVIDGSKEKSNDDYKAIFIQYAKGYNKDFTDEVLDDYWNQVIDDLTNDVRFDEFECRLQMYDDVIEYMQLSGKIE